MPPAAVPTKPAPPTAGVPAATPGRTGSAAPTLSPGQKVNINTASVAELEALPWIGPEKAKKIVAGRPYGKVDDVMKVSGTKEGVFAKIKDPITVD